MSKTTKPQTSFFKGIYEYEDPSGGLLAARVPATGSVDLYSGTVVNVRPGQVAIFIYKGQIAEVLKPGMHQIQTENFPVLTKLANWKFGFESPLRCELIFVGIQTFTSRRWGTPQPVLTNFKGFGSVPIRAFGNFSFSLADPKTFFLKLMGTKSTFPITEIEEFIQSQIVELLPTVLQNLEKFEDLATSYNEISKNLETAVKAEIIEYGLSVQKIQILSALPSKEVLEAMEAKAAIQIIGSQKEYLLYKAATSLGQPGDNHGNDPLQMMMGMMLGKGLIGADYHEKEKVPALEAKRACVACGQGLSAESRFCAACGKKV